MQSGNLQVQERIKQNGSKFGNKSANLIELDLFSKSFKSDLISIQIPEIYPLEDKTMKAYLDKNAPEWRQYWDKFVSVQGKNTALTKAAKDVLESLQNLIMQTFAKNPVGDDILNAIKLPADTLFMVRSTGEEDTVDMANPGGNKSVAAVKLDKESMSKALGVVVTSYLSEKSLTQRLLSGDDITKPSFMPVLIQRMIGEDIISSSRNFLRVNTQKISGTPMRNRDEISSIVISGVMYAYEDEARIDAAPGHGELIVNSKAPFDSYDVTAAGVVHAEVYHKVERLVPMEVQDPANPNGKKRKLMFKANPGQLRGESSLSPQIAKEMARVGEAISQHYGMPMDIEFVYHPHLNILYLVQARPIPQDLKHQVTPSAIAPEKWAEIKADAAMEKVKCHIIKDAGNAVRVVTAPEQIVHKKHIDKALKYYLQHPEIQGKVKAVIIKHDAPSTSHEAAFFNALGIPVIQASFGKIKPWLQEKNLTIVVDPQRHHIVNFSKKIKNAAKAEQELKADKIVTDGLFVSSAPISESLLPINYELSEPLKAIIASYLLKHEAVDKKHIYKQMLDCLDTFDGIKVGNPNADVFAALRKIAEIFKLIATSSQAKQESAPHKALFQHAMLAIAEIHMHLTAYSNMKDGDANKLKTLRRVLDSAAKLKAVVINPGKAGLYSDSIFQMAVSNKVLKSVASHVKGEEREYLREFLKFTAFGFKNDIKDMWIKLATYSSKTAYTQQLLAQIIKMASAYQFESELVNKLLVKIVDDYNGMPNDRTARHVLGDLYTSVLDIEKDLEKCKVIENQRKISAWESQIEEWGNPARFNQMYTDYLNDVSAMIGDMTVSDTMTSYTKNIILRQVQRLTEMMDKSIKNLKGSTDNISLQSVLVERFIKMLDPYFSLMMKWMDAIPIAMYDKWRTRIDNSSFNSKSDMMNAIETTYKSKKQSRDLSQLEPSGKISIATAKVGNTASFKRQFVNHQNEVTLEDLFSLMHQNILSATMVLANETKPDYTYLPDELQKIINELQSFELLGVAHKHPVISLEFNMPVQNHSIKLTIEYHTESRALTVTWGSFGANWNNRMNGMEKAFNLEPYAYNGTPAFTPHYNEVTFDLTSVWNIPAASLALFADKIGKVVRAYREMTGSYESSLPTFYHQMYERYFQGFNLNNIPAMFIEQFNKQVTEYGREAVDHLVENNPEIILCFNQANINLIESSRLSDKVSSLSGAAMANFITHRTANLDLSDTNGGSKTLLIRILDRLDSKYVETFLNKYKVDIRNSNILESLLAKANPDKAFIKRLVSAGVKINSLSFNQYMNLMKDPELEKMFSHMLATMTPEDYTIWLYNGLEKNSKNDVRDYLKRFGNIIDYNYKVAGSDYSVLSRLLQKSGKMFRQVVADRKIASFDLAVHSNILNVAMSRTGGIKYVEMILNQAVNLDKASYDFSIQPLTNDAKGTALLKSFLDKLPANKLNELFYATAARMGGLTPAAWSTFLNLLAQYKDKINFSYSSSSGNASLMACIISRCEVDVIYNFLDDVKPNLSGVSDAINMIKGNSQYARLQTKLLECGVEYSIADLNEISVGDFCPIYRSPGMAAKIDAALRKQSNSIISNFILDKFRFTRKAVYNLSKDEAVSFLDFVAKFKSYITIDSVDTGANYTLLENYFNSSKTFKNAPLEYEKLGLSFIAGKQISLAKHDDIFEKKLDACAGGLAKAVMDQAVDVDSLKSNSVENIAEITNLGDVLTSYLSKLDANGRNRFIDDNLRYLCNKGQAVLEKMISVIDLGHVSSSGRGSSGKAIFITLIENGAAAIVNKYLDEKKPDLSAQQGVLASYFSSGSLDVNFAMKLLSLRAYGRDCLAKDFAKLCKDAASKKIVMDYLKSWGQNNLSSWACDQLQNHSLPFELAMELIPSLDLDMSSGGTTILEHIIAGSIHSIADADKFADLLAGKKLDLNRHSHLIQLAANTKSVKLLNMVVTQGIGLKLNILMRHSNSDNQPLIMQLLDKKPDLSSDVDIIPYALAADKPDIKLINRLLECGAPCTNVTFNELMKLQLNSEVGKLMLSKVTALPNGQVNQWLYRGLCTANNCKADDVLAILEAFKNQIDFNFSDGVSNLKTTLEFCVGLMRDDAACAQRLTALLANKYIDMKQNNSILQFLQNTRNWGVFIAALTQQGVNFGSVSDFSLDTWLSSMPIDILIKLLEKLPAASLSKQIFDVLAPAKLSSYDGLIKLLERFSSSLDMSYTRNGKSLLSRLLDHAAVIPTLNQALYKIKFDVGTLLNMLEKNGQFIYDYLDKVHPDLSKDTSLINRVLTNRFCSDALINRLLACGMSCDNINFTFIIDAPVQASVAVKKINEVISSWGKPQFSAWMHAKMKELKSYNANDVLTVIKAHQGQIDFNFKPAGADRTLLEECIGKMKDEKDIAEQFAKFLGNDVVDLSRHTKMLGMLRNCHNWEKFIEVVAARGTHVNDAVDIDIQLWAQHLSADTLMLLLDKLTVERRNKIIYAALIAKPSASEMQVMNKILKHFESSLDMNYRSSAISATLGDKIIAGYDVNAAAKAMGAVKAGSLSLTTLLDAVSQPAKFQALVQAIKSWGKPAVSAWLAEELRKNNSKIDVSSYCHVLTGLITVIDLNYRNPLYTLTLADRIVEDAPKDAAFDKQFVRLLQASVVDGAVNDTLLEALFRRSFWSSCDTLIDTCVNCGDMKRLPSSAFVSSEAGRKMFIKFLDKLPSGKLEEYMNHLILDSNGYIARDLKLQAQFINIIEHYVSKVDWNRCVMTNYPGRTLFNEMADHLPPGEFKRIVDGNPSVFSKVSDASFAVLKDTQGGWGKAAAAVASTGMFAAKMKGAATPTRTTPPFGMIP